MSLEKIAILTAGAKSDFGSRPTEAQQNIIDRMRDAIDKQERESLRGLSAKDKKLALQKKRLKVFGTSATDDSGGQYHAKREELLGTMSGLSPLETDLIFYYYADDSAAHRRLIDELTLRAVDLHNSMDWKTPAKLKGRFIIRDMTVLSLEECKLPGLKLYDTSRAEALQIDYYFYRRNMKPRYAAVYRMVSGIASEAEGKCESGMKGRSRSLPVRAANQDIRPPELKSAVGAERIC